MTSVYQKGSGKPLSAELQAKMERLRAENIGKLVLAGFYELVAVEQPDRPPLTVKLSAEADDDSIVAAVLEVAKERKALHDRLRAALTAGSDHEALALARELVNLPKGASHGGKEAVH